MQIAGKMLQDGLIKINLYDKEPFTEPDENTK